MRAWINSLAVAAAMTFSAATLACDGAGKDGPKGTAGDTAKACSADKTACAKSCTNGKDAKAASHDKGLAAAGMPLMKYKVGDQVTACPKEAAKIATADGNDAKIRYVVGETEYADKTEALQAYASQLDDFLATMTTVRYAVADETVSCPVAAQKLAQDKGEAVKFRLASVTFADKTEAEKAAHAARQAADAVQMKTVRDGQTVTCSKEAEKGCAARKVAADQNKDCEYQVVDVKTSYPVTAKVELAKARIAAAQKALEQFGQEMAANNRPGA